MSREKKNAGSDKKMNKKNKEKKLTAAEKRRLLREQQRSGEDEDNPFAAFETPVDENDFEENYKIGQSRFANFDSDIHKKTEKDDYFERLYGSALKKGGAPSDDSDESFDPVSEQKETNSHRKPLTESQRKLRITASYVGVFLIIVAAAVLISLTVMFKTTDIVVEGENIPYSDEEIINTSGLKYSENIFMSKRKAAVKKIVEKYPYIENAEVTFRIPGTQIITVETAVASYQIASSDGFVIVSSKGRILEIVPQQRANIPLLKGLKLTISNVGEYINIEKSSTRQILDEVIESINENDVPGIYGIDISNTANIKLNYDNRITILLGVPEDVGYKLRTAMTIINTELAAGDRGDLDVSLASSERKSSYFTPIYSNTLSAAENSVSSAAADGASTDRSAMNGSTEIKSAEEYYNESRKNTSSEEEYDYMDDIIEDDEEYTEPIPSEEIPEKTDDGSYESQSGNIISDYGTQYN